MQIAHKIEIEPNNKQKTYLNKCFGISRFAYNWGLAEWKRKYENKEKVNGLLLKKEFNSIKKEQFTWVKEVTKWACQQPFLDLQSAFSKFFNKQSSFPKFKKKNKSVDSCYIANDSFKIVDNYYLKLPLLKNNIKMTEKIRFEGTVGADVKKILHRANYFIVYGPYFEKNKNNGNPITIPLSDSMPA